MTKHDDALPAIIAGALFDLMGYLTCRDERLTLSARDEAGPAVEALTAWAKLRGLSLDDARVQDWRAALAARSGQPVAWRYPVYWWQPMADHEHTEWHFIPRPGAIAATAYEAGVRPRPLYAAPPAPSHVEAMRGALILAYKACRLAHDHSQREDVHDAAMAALDAIVEVVGRDALRAALGEGA
jgi:hypothetical protein